MMQCITKRTTKNAWKKTSVAKCLHRFEEKSGDTYAPFR